MELEISEISEFSIWPYTEIENSEIFPILQIPKNVFYMRKLEISEVSMFSILVLILKSKTQKTWKFCVK